MLIIWKAKIDCSFLVFRKSIQIIIKDIFSENEKVFRKTKKIFGKRKRFSENIVPATRNVIICWEQTCAASHKVKSKSPGKVTPKINAQLSVNTRSCAKLRVNFQCNFHGHDFDFFFREESQVIDLTFR